MLHAEYQATTDKRVCCERSQAVAKECGDKYAIVTYDLAVAKIARQFRFKILQNLMTVSYSLVNFTQFYHYFYQ